MLLENVRETRKVVSEFAAKAASPHDPEAADPSTRFLEIFQKRQHGFALDSKFSNDEVTVTVPERGERVREAFRTLNFRIRQSRCEERDDASRISRYRSMTRIRGGVEYISEIVHGAAINPLKLIGNL